MEQETAVRRGIRPKGHNQKDRVPHLHGCRYREVLLRQRRYHQLLHQVGEEEEPEVEALVDAINELSDEQKLRYLDPPYTIGSAMIWPVRKLHRTTINKARGANLLIADRMDLTLKCKWLHYAGEQWSPLAKVIKDYEDFFELFGQREQGFKGFVDFFHFQDLIAPGSDYQEIEYFLEPNGFTRSGTPATKDEYIEYRENVLSFIKKRSARMAEWVKENHSAIEVGHTD